LLYRTLNHKWRVSVGSTLWDKGSLLFVTVIFLRSRKRTVPRKENRLWAHPLALLDLKSQKQSSNGE
ncbi:hypothetical protein E2320_012500, partial [Naja naja]